MIDLRAYKWVMMILTVIVVILILQYPNFFTFKIIVGLILLRIFVGKMAADGTFEYNHFHDHSHDYDLYSTVYGGNGTDGTTPNAINPTDDETSKYMKMSLMDPKHNLREIAKQLILLEDHMAHKEKRCIDCITKHYLMTEGLLEETVTLDKEGLHKEEVRNITEKVKPAVMTIINIIKGEGKPTEEEYHAACQVLRKVRKEIALKYVLNT